MGCSGTVDCRSSVTDVRVSETANVAAIRSGNPASAPESFNNVTSTNRLCALSPGSTWLIIMRGVVWDEAGADNRMTGATRSKVG